MNELIDPFLEEHTCASFACLNELGNPYCFTCFYAINIQEGLLYFKSSFDTKHSGYLQTNPNVAGTILPDKLNKLQVKGIQLEGIILPFDDILTKNAATQYYKQHPMAVTVAGEIWTVKINKVKFTDTTLGFGKKIIWDRENYKQ